MNADQKAKQIVSAILRDLKGRKGLRHQWEQIDDDIQEEIVSEWTSLASQLLEQDQP